MTIIIIIIHLTNNQPHSLPKMAAKMLFVLLLAVASVLSAAEGKTHNAAAPAPAVDCSTVILNMADCLSFVSNDSTTSKPEKTCCDGLKTVLNTDAECLCEALKSSAQLGVVLNITKALSLPSACHIKAPAASNCGLSLTGGAPGPSPSAAVSPSVAATPTGSTGTNGNEPALSPRSSARGLSTSFRSLIVGLFLVIVSCF